MESITGLSPAIAIDQKTTSKNPRSTVGTVTEIYDYMRLLYARIGVPHSPATGLPIESQTVSQMVERINTYPMGTKLLLLAPLIVGGKGEYKKELLEIKKLGYQRVQIDKEIVDLTTLPVIEKNKKHDISVVVDRIQLSEDLGNRLADSIESVLKLSQGLLIVEIVELPEDEETTLKKGDSIVFSEKFSCPISGFSLSEIEPRLFSFNSPYGACPECDGLGTEFFFDPDLIIPDGSLSLNDGAIAPWVNMPAKLQSQILESLASHYKSLDLDVPYESLPEDMKQILLHGTGTNSIKMRYEDGIKTITVEKPFEGIVSDLQNKWHKAENTWYRDELSKFQNRTKCNVCQGYRLKKESLCVKIAGHHVGEITEFTITAAQEWFINLPSKLNTTHNAIAERILKELEKRLGFLINVGLDYLTLSRESGTLSGGESQRIRLASQIGSGLSGVLYVLDEPSIGLHQCDNDKLLVTLKNLRDLGNTVIVVEHDEDTIRSADYLVDIGPGAGVHGGHIIAEGTPEEVENNPNSITGQYLKGERFIPVPNQRRVVHLARSIRIVGARANNLKRVTLEVPLGTFCCITGVSGGGKSSLIIHTLYKALAKFLNGAKTVPGPYDTISGIERIDKVVEIDQSPIGRTPRSNPATYTGAFSHIRDWFTALPESKARGYKAGRFSFNVKGGRCETCQGDGMIKIEMHFLPDVYVECDGCKGARYNKETLEVQYKGKSISDVLSMTVEDALQFFEKIPLIKEKLLALKEVGLGYITIGQSATTLSGGEAQRVKLAKELSKRSTGRTFYILDEPTTGLHSEDINKLLSVLHKLVDSGNTVLVIEHNLDVVKTADWIIDVGPGGGLRGGIIVAQGAPEDVVKVEESITGAYLKPYLLKNRTPLPV